MNLINKNNFTHIKEKIVQAAKKSGRRPKDIQLVAITKRFPVSAIQQAYNNDIFCVGESRIQESENKLKDLSIRNKLEVHLIGHLQSNKAKKAIQLYDVIETVDTIKLAKKIASISGEIKKVQRIYLQVNSGQDPLKKGFSLNEIEKAALEIAQMKNLIISGIMMIPPFIEMDDRYRKIYSSTRELRDKLLALGISSCKDLSMGMSRDYEMAIEEGATHIRIGTALFGQRA